MYVTYCRATQSVTTTITGFHSHHTSTGPSPRQHHYHGTLYLYFSRTVQQPLQHHTSTRRTTAPGNITHYCTHRTTSPRNAVRGGEVAPNNVAQHTYIVGMGVIFRIFYNAPRGARVFGVFCGRRADGAGRVGSRHLRCRRTVCKCGGREGRLAGGGESTY